MMDQHCTGPRNTKYPGTILFHFINITIIMQLLKTTMLFIHIKWQQILISPFPSAQHRTITSAFICRGFVK